MIKSFFKDNIHSVSILLVVVLMISCLTACNSDNFATDEIPEYGVAGDVLDNNKEIVNDSITSSKGESSDYESRKIITTVTYSAETKQFDELIPKIEGSIKEQSGYIESSNTQNNREYRVLRMTIRIPSKNGDIFNGFIESNTHVLNKSVQTKDATLQYADLESRLSSLRTQKESLERLLAEAESVQSMMDIQDRLSDVIYEIEKYQSSLNILENQVSYDTINLTITEVEKETIIEEQTIWQEIKDGFTENASLVGKFLRAVFVGFISHLPVIGMGLVVGIIVALCVHCKRKCVKRNRTTVDTDKPSDEK